MTLEVSCLLTQYVELGSPQFVVSGRLISNQVQFEQFAVGATAYELREVADRLNAIDAEQERRRAAAAPERPPVDPDTPDPATVLTMEVIAEGQRQTEYRASTAGRLETIEGLLRDIAAKLEKR